MKNQNEECIIIPSKVNNTHKHKRQKRYKDFYLITLYILQKFKNAKYLCSAFVKNSSLACFSYPSSNFYLKENILCQIQLLTKKI